MLTVVTWLWNRPGGPGFTADYVNRTRSMLERNLRLDHELVCVTDMTAGLDPRIRVVTPPAEFINLPRCRRRMWQFSKERVAEFGRRVLALDLDVVIVNDITRLVDRREPIVGWRVGYAGVLSGSFLLYDVGALDGAWRAYSADPDGFPKRTGERNASDQAMVNYWLTVSGTKVAKWTEADGFVSWFGDGYERLEHHGMGPTRNTLTPGARVVVLGSADKAVLDEGRYDWVREHWR